MTADLTTTINEWIATFQKYSLEKICQQPAPGKWSLGQVGLHLIADSHFYLERIHACLHENANQDKTATPFARKLFANNAFPDVEIVGDPANDLIPQPGSKDELIKDFMGLRDAFGQIAAQALDLKNTGKSLHPGLGYFDAAQWYRFADIHMRHHLRQKKKIEATLE